MLYDFHSHILPEVDDGSRSIEQSIAMLDMLRNSGVGTVVATPHFYYNKTNVDRFLTKREAAYQRLTEATGEKKGVQIRKGAEVLLTTDIPNLDGLEKLCIENTAYILIELPYSYWSSWVYRAIDEIAFRGLKPIIAHIDRYSWAGDDCIRKIFDLNCLIQLNTDAVIDKHIRKKAFKYIKNGEIHLLGSDAHDDKRRPPRFTEAMEILRKKFGPDIERVFEENSLYVLNNQG